MRFEGFTDPFSGFLSQRSWSQERDLLINSKILLTKPHSGIAVLMLSYLLPIRWQGHTLVSDHTEILYFYVYGPTYVRCTYFMCLK